MPPESFEIVNAWQAGSDALRAAIVAFWTEHGALPSDAGAAERAAEVVLVARDAAGIIGVCSAYNAISPRLEHRMFHYRTFVAPRARRSHVAQQLMEQAKTFLEAHNGSLPESERALGVLVEVEAAALTAGSSRHARWPVTQMNFIGRTPAGSHLRLWYFDDALLQFPAGGDERPAPGAPDDAGLTFVNLRDQPSEVRAEVVALWQQHGVLPAGVDAERRAAQVLLVARDAAGIAGVCTTYTAISPVLEHPMVHFRAFTAPRMRRSLLATQLLQRAMPILEADDARLPDDQRTLGMLLEVEARVLQAGGLEARRARWRRGTHMNFIGRTPRGSHQRVWYFTEAKLNFVHPTPPQALAGAAAGGR